MLRIPIVFTGRIVGSSFKCSGYILSSRPGKKQAFQEVPFAGNCFALE